MNINGKKYIGTKQVWNIIGEIINRNDINKNSISHIGINIKNYYVNDKENTNDFL